MELLKLQKVFSKILNKILEGYEYVQGERMLETMPAPPKKFFFSERSFTRVVLPAPEGDERITIVPLFFKDI